MKTIAARLLIELMIVLEKKLQQIIKSTTTTTTLPRPPPPRTTQSLNQTYSATEAVVTVPKRLGKRILGRFTIPLREMSDKEEKYLLFLVGHVMSLTCFHDERTDQHKMHPIARMGLQLDFWWISGPCVEFLCLEPHEVIISGGAAWPVWAQCRAPPSYRALQTWKQSMESLKKKKVAQKGLKWTIMGTCSSSFLILPFMF